MKKFIMFLAVFLGAFSFVTSASAIPITYAGYNGFGGPVRKPPNEAEIKRF